MPPYRRNIGMVFQNYALFPHLTVADNIGFPLKQRGVPKAERARLVAEALELVHLPGYGARYPRQLSGGQQQRVALARAIVFQPRLLLMDEPLGALDKQLRENLQLEMRRLHADLGITFIYVTHDQEEALTMSDRIAVMNDGLVAQVGTPEDLYDRPTRPLRRGLHRRVELPAGRRARHGGRRRGRRMRGRDHPRGVPGRPAARREGDADDAAGAPALRRRRLERRRSPQNRLSVTVTEAVFAGERCRYLLQAGDGTPMVLKEPSSAAIRRRARRRAGRDRLVGRGHDSCLRRLVGPRALARIDRRAAAATRSSPGGARCRCCWWRRWSSTCWPSTPCRW